MYDVCLFCRAEVPDFPRESRVLLDNIGKLDRGEPINTAQPVPSPMGTAYFYLHHRHPLCGTADSIT